MRAVVYRGRNDLRVESVPVPRIASGELLVKVTACGVCPTDIKKIEYGTLPPPRIFGHETAGTIVRAGSQVRGFKIGDRVALHHHVPCPKCHFCRHHAFAQCAQYKKVGITAGFEPAGGGYAEFVRVMPFVLPGVVKIPPRNGFMEGAMLEPVNTVLKAVNRLTLLPGDSVLVAGQGPVGQMFTRLLALRGIQVLASDCFESRLCLARHYGARWLYRVNGPSPQKSSLGQARHRPQATRGLSCLTGDFSEAVERITRGRGMDAAVVAVASDAVVRQCQDVVRPGGQVLLFAHTKRGDEMPLDLSRICVDEKDLIGSYSADFLLQREVARLVFSRQMDVRPLISHRFPLEQTAAAIRLASHPTPDSLKIVVEGLSER